MMRRIDSALTATLQAASSVAIIAHVNPDGDTIGSCLALQQGLLQLGKTAQVFCADKVPDSLMMLTGADQVRVKPAEGEAFDAAMAVDVSDAYRMGSCADILHAAPVTLMIDHHGTNPGDWAQLAEVDGNAPACALLVYQLLLDLGVTLTADMAGCLYTAIATDTGNYAYKGTNVECFQVTAALLETGFDMESLNRRLFRVRAIPQSRLMCRALENLTLHAGSSVAAIRLTLQDFGDCGALPQHADTLVNLGLQLQGVKMALLARETPTGAIKFSLRAIPPYQVNGIAKSFGGGGHPLAAGCSFPDGQLQERITQVLSVMESTM